MSSTDTLLFKIVMPVLLVTGVYTNTMNIIIIYRLRRLFNAFVFYFIGESASDMCLVVFVMVPRWFESLVHLRLEFPIEGQWLCKINICLLYVSVTVSAWIQAAMSLQRMSGVIWPHLVRSTRVVKMAQISVFSIVVLVMILHFGVLFGDTFNMSNCYLGSANAPANSVAGKIQSLVTLSLTCLVPAVVIIASNVVLLKMLIRSAEACACSGRVRSARSVYLQRSQVHTITQAVMGTALVHIFLTTPVYFVEALVVTGIIPVKSISADGWAVLIIMFVSKSSLPFFIYRWSGTPFRLEAEKLTAMCLMKPSVQQDRPIASRSTWDTGDPPIVRSQIEKSDISTHFTDVRRSRAGIHQSEIGGQMTESEPQESQNCPETLINATNIAVLQNLPN